MRYLAQTLICRRLLLAVFALAGLGVLPGVAAAADRAFAPKYQTHTRGNLTSAANTLFSCAGNGGACVDNRAGTGSDLTNGGNMAYVNADTDATTFNSSSATLTMPAGATVAWAGLYWGADSSAGTGGAAPPAAALRGTVLFDTPAAGSYATVTSSQLDTPTGFANRFQAFADVTAEVTAGGSGTYWAANVQGGTGADRYGGWTLVVAYRLASQPVRNLSVYDGLVTVLGGGTSTLALNNFTAPASGTVRANLGFTTWEGELGYILDGARLNGTTLSDAQNPAANFFNASIATNGTRVTSKTPDYVNQMGFDSDVVTADGLIANGATSATMQLTSSIETYHAGVASFAVDQIPELPTNSAAPTLSGTARDGQTLTATSGSWSGTTSFSYAYQWQRCNAAGASCSDIAGATGSTYTLTAADVDGTVKAVLTATNTEGTGSASSAASAAVQAISPANTALPAISGTTTDGQTLSTSNGSWSGSAPFTYGYQWRRCDAAGLVCSDIAGATGSTYALTSPDVANTIRVVVTATNSGGSSTGTAAQTAVVAPLAPANSALPVVSGTARDGQTLSTTAGSWTGTTPMTHAYQWQRCDAAGANCADIASATASTYDLIPADVGGTVRVVVTATNAGGSVSAPSAVSATVAPLAPSNSSVPSFSGTLRDGQTLTAANGTWTGTPTITYAHQWQRCDAAGSNCADMSGETGATHELTAADVGRTVRLVVTASNGGGSTSATSPVSAVVLTLGPGSTSPPAISGIERDEETLTSSTGAWSGTAPLGFGYQWQRCDGPLCEDIAGATGSSYDLVGADVGKTIQVVVTATNGGGSAPATSDPSGVIQALAPANSSLPSVGGTLRDGQTLTAGDGAWTGTAPFDYAYRWQRCDADGNGCVDIAGADQPTYDLASADVGNTIRLQVTASNDAGSDMASSVASGVVQALAPAAGSTPPAVSGTMRDGQTLTADNGSFTGTGPFNFTYQWQRCDADGTNCLDITGATGSTWPLGGEDAGHRVRVLVTAMNGAGSATAASAVSSVVQALAPDNVDPPGVLGTLRDGETLNADTGDWTGTGPIAHGYQWQRCDAQGLGCQDINGATSPSYELTDADAGSTVRVLVTGTNGAGSDSGASPVSGLVRGIAPGNAEEPSVTGTPRNGETMSADDGEWTGTGPIARSFQWQRCDAQGTNCQDIGGANGSTYELGVDDVGHTLRVVVTATNIEGSQPAASQPSGIVTAAGAPPEPPADPQPPATIPPAPTPAPTPPPGNSGATGDLSALPGSLLAANSCQQAGGARVLVFNVPGAGRLRIRVAPNGTITSGQPLLAQALVTPKAARTLKKALRHVSYTLGSRKLGAKRKAPYALKITPAQLSAAPRQTLVVQVVPKKGKPRVAMVNLSSEPCPDLFSVVHRPSPRGSLLGLRVDTRKQVRTVVFKVPARLLPAKAAKGSAGALRLGVSGQPIRNLRLTFPKKKTRGASLLSAAGGPQVLLKRGTVTVTNLPAGTGIVQLKLKARGMKKTPKTTLRASLQVDGGPGRALKQKLGIKLH